MAERGLKLASITLPASFGPVTAQGVAPWVVLAFLSVAAVAFLMGAGLLAWLCWLELWYLVGWLSRVGSLESVD